MSMMATSYGICGVFARIFTIMAPSVAEIKPDTVPKWIYVIVAGLALLASMNLKPLIKNLESSVKGKTIES